MKLKLFAALFMVLSLFATSAFAADANTTNTTNETINETIELNETIEINETINETINDSINTTLPNESIDDALNDTLNETEEEDLENEYEEELKNISAALPGGFGRFIARVGDAFTFNETKKAERAMERVRENKLRILKRMHERGTGLANTKYADELEKLQQYIGDDLEVVEETIEDGETEQELESAVEVSGEVQKINVLDNMIQKKVNETFQNGNFTDEQKQKIQELVDHVGDTTKKAHANINEKKVNTAARVIASGKNLEDVKELKIKVKEKVQNRGKPEWAGNDDEDEEENETEREFEYEDENGNKVKGKYKEKRDRDGEVEREFEYEEEREKDDDKGKPEWAGNDDEEESEDEKEDESEEDEDDEDDEEKEDDDEDNESSDNGRGRGPKQD